jgi:hypothetical protein
MKLGTMHGMTMEVQGEILAVMLPPGVEITRKTLDHPAIAATVKIMRLVGCDEVHLNNDKEQWAEYAEGSWDVYSDIHAEILAKKLNNG